MTTFQSLESVWDTSASEKRSVVLSLMQKLFHGKQSEITHDGQGIFKGINSPVKVARYHSLAVQKESLPECLVVTAETEDGEIMAVRHKKYPVYGLQFHPESILTPDGQKMIENFLKISRK